MHQKNHVHDMYDKIKQETFSMKISYVERAIFIIRKKQPCLHNNNADLSKQKKTYLCANDKKTSLVNSVVALLF